MLKTYRDNSRLLDPAIGALAGLVIYLAPIDSFIAQLVHQAFNGNRGAIYGALATIFGSLLGFSIASVAIVVTVVRLPGMRYLRRASSADKVWTTFHSAIRWLAFGTMLSLLGLALDRDNAPKLALTCIVVFAAVTAALRLSNSIWVLEILIGSAVHDERSRGEA